MPPVFKDVKQVLDTIIVNWTAGNGAPPQLTQKHQSPSFKWDTKDDLLAATARNIQLIQPGVIGQKGIGQTANIVVALTTGVGGFPPMPFGGLDSANNKFLTLQSPEIMTIVAWIEGGCLP